MLRNEYLDKISIYPHPYQQVTKLHEFDVLILLILKV